MSNPFDEQIYLYGPPFSGKSTTGALLAAALDLPFIDLDHEIEKRTSHLIPQIFQDEGEEGFRQHESEMLDRLVQAGPAVIALGGGSLLAADNRRMVEKHGQVIYIDTPQEVLLERFQKGSTIRPLLSELPGSDTPLSHSAHRLSTLLEQRAAHYASFPAAVTAGKRTPEELVELTQIKLGRFHVRGMGMPYEVLIRSGLSDQTGAILAAHRLHEPVALLADEHVAPLHAGSIHKSLIQAGFKAVDLRFPAGEQAKTIATATQIWQDMLENGIERRSTLAALGGGVTTDLGGYAAAAYMRGIPWVALPTSLLGMVDASIGGKTGLDLMNGKNIVGAFHPPRLVLIDPDFLGSLPQAEFNNGMAEVIKAAIIGDEELFSLCSAGPAPVMGALPEVIARAISVKIKVIQADPFEEGLRAVLNLGHTLGHAIEAASGYRVRHGEAIASGIAAAARLAQRRNIAEPGLVEQITQTLTRFSLPVNLLTSIPAQNILVTLRKDKKRAAGAHRFVLPQKIGSMTYGVEIDEAEICTLY